MPSLYLSLSLSDSTNVIFLPFYLVVVVVLHMYILCSPKKKSEVTICVAKRQAPMNDPSVMQKKIQGALPQPIIAVGYR